MIIELNQPYYWMRTDGWKNHLGEDRWWEVFVVVLGWNGSGGWWVRKNWHHSGEPIPHSSHVETLGLIETFQLKHELEVVAALRTQKKEDQR